MKGLLLKDLYMVSGYCRAFLLIVAVFLAVSFFGDDNVFFVVYPVMVAGIIPVTLISYDERDKWLQYSGTLPYTRSQLVSSKYLIGLIFGVAAFAISMVATAVRMLMQGYFSVREFLTMGMILLVLGLIGPMLLLPFIFKFGAEKGRIAFYVMLGIICAAGTVLAGFGVQTVFSLNSLWIFVVICGIALALYALSWRVSIQIFLKREL
jgi:ABC-2 type transport system permease protein